MNYKKAKCPHSNSTTLIYHDDYTAARKFLVDVLIVEKEITLLELLRMGEESKQLALGQRTSWCLLVVKQDLEANKMIRVRRSAGKERTQTIMLMKSKLSLLNQVC